MTRRGQRTGTPTASSSRLKISAARTLPSTMRAGPGPCSSSRSSVPRSRSPANAEAETAGATTAAARMTHRPTAPNRKMARLATSRLVRGRRGRREQRRGGVGVRRQDQHAQQEHQQRHQQHQQRERGEGQPTPQPGLELLDDQRADQRHARLSRPRVEKSRKCGRGRAAFDAEVGHAAAGADQLGQQRGQGFLVAGEQKPDVAAVFVDLQLAHIAALAEQRDARLQPSRSSTRTRTASAYCGAASAAAASASPLHTRRRRA